MLHTDLISSTAETVSFWAACPVGAEAGAGYQIPHSMLTCSVSRTHLHILSKHTSIFNLLSQGLFDKESGDTHSNCSHRQRFATKLCVHVHKPVVCWISFDQKAVKGTFVDVITEIIFTAHISKKINYFKTSVLLQCCEYLQIIGENIHVDIFSHKWQWPDTLYSDEYFVSKVTFYPTLLESFYFLLRPLWRSTRVSGDLSPNQSSAASRSWRNSAGRVRAVVIQTNMEIEKCR